MLVRPAAITVVAGFLFLASAIVAFVGFSILFPNALLNLLWSLYPAGKAFIHAVGGVYGPFLIALGCGTFFVALGLLHRRRWAWWFAVLLFLTDAIGKAVSYFLTHDPLRTVLGAIVSLGFFYLLCRREARAYMHGAPVKNPLISP